MKSLGLLVLVSVILSGCASQNEQDQAQQVIDKAIEANGAHLFATKKVAFDFRKKHYTVARSGSEYTYTRSFEDSIGQINDVLVNSSAFSRSINGQKINLSEEWQTRFGNSVNSVLYFVEILYRLNDAAVFKSYLGKTTIMGEKYHVIKVTFSQDGGGTDFQDEYRYWIHESNYTLDYLAYNYETDGGGARFRSAFDRTKVGGITFQNYVNYKPVPDTKETPLDDLPKFFEAGELKELSRIINENIEVG